jgi:hypothetical protein
MKGWNFGLSQGAGLMLIASLAFVGYAVVFFFRNFAGGGFELGVTTLNGVTPDALNALNPAIMHYIKHLHLAISAFIAATAIAVGALSWYGVRRGEWWAWTAAVASAVVGPEATHNLDDHGQEKRHADAAIERQDATERGSERRW